MIWLRGLILGLFTAILRLAVSAWWPDRGLGRLRAIIPGNPDIWVLDAGAKKTGFGPGAARDRSRILLISVMSIFANV